MRPEDVRLSIVIPTIGRPSLYKTLHSIYTGGISAADEIFVAGDGPRGAEAEIIVRAFSSRMPVSYLELPLRQTVGHSQRNHFMRIATGTNLMSIDDDDVYTPGSLTRVKHDIARFDGKILIYKMKSMTRGKPFDLLWKEQKILVGNIGTPMIVVPNDKAKLGMWGERYTGDFDFVESTVRNYGEQNVEWIDYILAEIY